MFWEVYTVAMQVKDLAICSRFPFYQGMVNHGLFSKPWFSINLVMILM